MRNVFDQYTQPENRLTHALMTALHEDRKLLADFIVWVTGRRTRDPKKLIVTEQNVPGEEEPSEDAQKERRGLPDGWIQDGDDWALLIENKIEARLTLDQLRRHRRMAERRGLRGVDLLAIVVKKDLKIRPRDTLLKEWAAVYEWLRGKTRLEWAKRTTDYMETLEGKLAEEEYLKEGTLTRFTGIPFGPERPYSYLEAKRVLRLLTDELRKQRVLAKRLGMDPRGKGRPAIMGRSVGRIWDFIPLRVSKGEAAFTACPHLTLSVQTERLVAAITIPNGLKPSYRRNLVKLDRDEFRDLMERVFKRMSHLDSVGGASPKIEILQRHYPSQRSDPIIDASLEFNLGTAFEKPRQSHKIRKPRTKFQPQWLEVAHDVLTQRKSNLQMVVGADFDYARCKEIHTPAAVDLVRDTWLACGPLLNCILGRVGNGL